MTKKDLIKHLANAAAVSDTSAEKMLNALVATVHAHARSGEELQIADLGKFSVGTRAARPGRNPKTGETIEIPAMRVPKFSAAKSLKDAAAQR